MTSEAKHCLAAATILMLIALFGDVLIDDGRVDRRAEYSKSQQAYTERVFCEITGICR